MSFLFSYLTRVWRRKPTVLTIVAVTLILLVGSYSRSSNSEIQESEYAQKLVGAHKKLQQAYTEPFEAVQFIPGVPGSGSNTVKKTLKAPPNHSGYYGVEEGKYQKGSHETRPRLVKDQVRQRAKEQKKALEVRRIQKNKHKKLLEGYQQHKSHGQTNTFEVFDAVKKLDGPVGDNSIFEKNPPQPKGDEGVEYVGQGQGQGAPQGGLWFDMNDRDQVPGLDGGNQYLDTRPSPSQPLYIPPQRLVHLDLKGAPPSIHYLQKVLTLSKELGATGVLVEWEDMFPWTGSLALTAATNHYTVEEVQDLLAHCEGLELDVIPLVQTFGHLEFVLKHEEFSYLRDVPEMPESICPCHNDTMTVVREIVDQVMALHKGAKSLHIGCDEVYHLGECSECQGDSRTNIFVDHVVRVAQYARTVHKVTPIIWDDMLRNLMAEEMQPLATLVEPMVWVYAEEVYRFVPSYTWDRYAQVFPYMWTASAFKGAHGETLVVPDSKRHLTNNMNWLTLMGEQEPKLSGGFRGIVLTGWQRYDHFAVLCELLPAALPSLAINLLATSSGFFNASLGKSLYQGMGCVEHGGMHNSFVDLEVDNFLWDKMSWCFFPGVNFFSVTKQLVSLEVEVDEFFKKVQKKKGWLTEYNIRHSMSSPFRIDELLEDWSRHLHEVVSLMKSSKEALSEMFDRYTVSEWIEQKLYPMYSKLSALRQAGDGLRRVSSWPSRPYEPLEALKGLGIGTLPTSSSPPPRPQESSTERLRRKVQAPDYYSSRRRQSS